MVWFDAQVPRAGKLGQLVAFDALLGGNSVVFAKGSQAYMTTKNITASVRLKFSMACGTSAL